VAFLQDHSHPSHPSPIETNEDKTARIREYERLGRSPKMLQRLKMGCLSREVSES
jgi:hypothetical protein